MLAGAVLGLFCRGKVWLASNTWSTWGCSKSYIAYCFSAAGHSCSCKGGLIWTVFIMAFGIPGNSWTWLGACEWGIWCWKAACWLYKDCYWFTGPSLDNWWLFCACLWDEWVICYCWMKEEWETWLGVRYGSENCREMWKLDLGQWGGLLNEGHLHRVLKWPFLGPLVSNASWLG